MNIGIYGNSIAQWLRYQPYSFISRLKSHYNANIVNVGCPAGSEERILFELKKTKKLDVAIVFHADPRHIFVPSINRDISSMISNDLLKKFTDIDKQQYNEDILNFNNLLEEKNLNVLPADYKELVNALVLNKKYLYHPDLQRNRYHGALIQIDQYLTAKQIPVVHCLEKHEMPNWFEFTSGIVDTDIYNWGSDPQYSVRFSESDNCINAAGNQLIFKKLVTLINAACSRQEYTNYQIRDGGSNPPAAPK